MNVPMQVTVPMDLAMRLREKLDAIKAEHNRQVEAATKRAAAGGKDKGAEIKALFERGKRLTIQHLVRVVLRAGAEAAEQPVAKLLDAVASDTVVTGRPKEKARGPRVAA